MKKHVVGLATMPLIVAGVTGAVASPAFADNGYTSTGCDGLQQAINNSPDAEADSWPFSLGVTSNINLTENCSANITIPRNKSIVLLVNGSTLTNAGGNTITVEEGASLFIASIVNTGGGYANTTDGKAIIVNHGLTVVDSPLTATNGAYTLVNDGETDITYTIATGFKVDNAANGILRIANGTVDNEAEAKPFVTGCLNTDECNDGTQEDFKMPNFMPVGFTANYKYKNPQYQATVGTRIGSYDSDVVEITGSTLDGYNLTAKKAGDADIYDVIWLGGAGNTSHVYDVYSNTKGLLNQDIYEHLVETYGYVHNNSSNALTQALDEGKDIYVNLYVDDMDGDSVDAEEKSAIADAAGGATIVGYADITLAIETNEGDLIEQVAYILPRASNASGNVLYDGSVDVRWSGLELAQPASGYQRNYSAIGVHNGKATKVAARVDENGDVVFPAGAFSTYAIVYEDVEVPATEDEADAAGTPETGAAISSDNGKTIASLVGCIMAGITVAFAMMPKIRKHLKIQKH